MTDRNGHSNQHEIASSAIWRWREGQFELEGRSIEGIRKQGLMRSSIMLVMSALFFFLGFDTLWKVLLGMALLIAVLAACFPLGAYQTFDRQTHAVVNRVFIVLQWMMLVFVFVFFFIPFGKLFRGRNRGPIKLDYSAESDSYWHDIQNQPAERDKQF